MAKRKGRPRVEYITPIVQLTSVTVHVSVRIEDRHSRMAPGGDKWLEVQGAMDEPVQGISEIQLSVHERTEDISEREPRKSVGGVIRVRPYVQALVYVPQQSFDRLWEMAAGGRLSYLWISITKPQGTLEDVVSISFTNQPIE